MSESPRLDRDARREERARIARLGRLPPLYEYSLRGRAQTVIAVVLQGLLAIGLGLLPVKLLTGDWLPPGAAFAVLGSALVLQALARYLNAKAGRT